MTAEQLGNLSIKDLGQLAKERGVPGWHGMRKAQLVKALAKVMSNSRARRTSPGSKTKTKAAKAAASTKKRTSTTRATTTRKAAKRRSVAAPSKPRSATTPTSRSTNSGKSSTSSRNSSSARNGTLRSVAKTSVAQTSVTKNPAAKPAKKAAPAPPPRKPSAVARKIQRQAEDHRRRKTLSTSNGRAVEDVLIVMVRDSYWLHATWELSPQGVARAEAALGQEWHGARPVLRLNRVTSDGSRNSTETAIKHIAIHGGVNHWYINVDEPPQSYRLDIGYLAASGKMFVLARSNTVTTPEAGVADAMDANWSDVARNADKVFAMSGGNSTNGSGSELQRLMEERLRRPMSVPVFPDRLQVHRPNGEREFEFEIDAEMIVYGRTAADARVTLAGDPVKLRPDGTFTVRFNLPNCRQVIPAVADSADGVERRTVVLAVERNTKVMEPIMRDGNNADG